MRRFPPLPVDDLFDVFPVPIEVIAKHYYGIEIHRRGTCPKASAAFSTSSKGGRTFT
jgi:hypothetical protein